MSLALLSFSVRWTKAFGHHQLWMTDVLEPWIEQGGYGNELESGGSEGLDTSRPPSSLYSPCSVWV